MDIGDRKGMTRRDFAKTTAAAAGFAILSSRSLAQQSSTDTLKVGLLGCGSRGGGAAMQMLLGNENVQLVALADVFQDKLDAKRKEIAENANPAISQKVAVTDDHCFVGLDAYKKIIATDIDILIDGTLPYCRPTHLVAAMEAGKHIFTEKPIGVDVAGIRKVIEAAKAHKEKGLSFVAGTQRRHDKQYQEMVKRVHDGAIGDIVGGRVYWCGGLPFVHERKPEWSDLEYRIRNWYGYCWIAGDNIVEQHVHNLDVANWLLKDVPPVSVFASGGRAWKPNEEKYGDIFDHFECDYEYPDGQHIFSFSRHWEESDGGVFEHVVGTKGEYDTSKRQHEIRGANAFQWSGEKEDPYVQEHIDLVNSIRKTGPYWHEAEQVCHSTLVAVMGRESAYTGKRLKWDEFVNSDFSLVPEDLSFDKPYPVRPVPRPGAPKELRG
jgi:predicted dehydrogenase